jgi:hypothetical protein
LLRVVSESIVRVALFRVREHFEGLRDLLKSLFGALVARIHIGVMFSGQAPICLLDIVRLRAARHAEHFVIVGRWHLQIRVVTESGKPVSAPG